MGLRRYKVGAAAASETEVVSSEGVITSQGAWTFPCSIGNLTDMEQCLEEIDAMFAGLGCAVAVAISVQTPEGRAEK
jgi:hypothetical protein